MKHDHPSICDWDTRTSFLHRASGPRAVCQREPAAVNPARAAGPAVQRLCARVVKQNCLGLILSFLVVAGCGGTAGDPGGREKMVVAVSVTPQAWLVEQIGGQHVEVLVLVQPADNPHSYQPSDAQVSRVMQAGVFFRIGVPFENGPWFDAIRSSSRVPIVDTRQGISLRESECDAHGEHEHEHDHGHAHGEGDPHIWLSPRLLKIQARTIARTLAELDPPHQADYQKNLLALDDRLDQLDARLRELLHPVAGKAFFVFHPAWGYFADEYGLEQVAIEVEGKQPSDAELTGIQVKARELGIRVVFVQPQITGQAAQAVADAVGARVERLDPLARHIEENLLRAAEAIAQSYQEKPSGNDG